MYPCIVHCVDFSIELVYPRQTKGYQYAYTHTHAFAGTQSTADRCYDFDFDRVFGPVASQTAVFEEISQLVQSALDGYNVCIFAYGTEH